MTLEGTIVRGTQAVADHFGVKRRTVQRWAKDPTFPRFPGRRFDLVQIQIWLDLRDGRPSTPPASGPGPRQPELTEERGKNFQDERLKRHKADLAEIEVKQRRGELVKRLEVQQLFIARIMAVKQGLLNLSRSLPPLLIHCQTEREMEILIARVVRELLEEFSRPLPQSLVVEGQAPGCLIQRRELLTENGEWVPKKED